MWFMHIGTVNTVLYLYMQGIYCMEWDKVLKVIPQNTGYTLQIESLKDQHCALTSIGLYRKMQLYKYAV